MSKDEYVELTFLPQEAEDIKRAYISICYFCKYATTMSRPWLEAGYVGCRAKWVVNNFDEQEVWCSDSRKEYANTISRPFNWAANTWHECLVVQGCIDCPSFKQY